MLAFKSIFFPGLVYAGVISRIDMEYWKGRSSTLYLVVIYYMFAFTGMFIGAGLLSYNIYLAANEDAQHKLGHLTHNEILGYGEYHKKPGIDFTWWMKDDHSYFNTRFVIAYVFGSIFSLICINRQLRLKVRKYYRMEERSQWIDWPLSVFCHPCNLVQNAREMELFDVTFKMIDRV